MEEEKIPTSINDLLFSSFGFFRQNLDLQRFCLVLEGCSMSYALLVYHHFANRVLSRKGPVQSIEFNVLSDDKRIPDNLVRKIKERKDYIFIHAPHSIEINELSEYVYRIDMDKFEPQDYL